MNGGRNLREVLFWVDMLVIGGYCGILDGSFECIGVVVDGWGHRRFLCIKFIECIGVVVDGWGHRRFLCIKFKFEIIIKLK